MPKPIQDMNTVFQRHDAIARVRDTVGRQRGIKAIGMHQEGGATCYIGLKQAHARISGVPIADHNEIELVPQKLVDDILVTAIDFEEVSKRAQRCRSVLVFRLGAEDIADRIRGIAVLADKRFK